MTDSPSPEGAEPPQRIEPLSIVVGNLVARYVEPPLRIQAVDDVLALLKEARRTPAPVEREAALPEPSLDVERLAATEWAYDTMPESFDVMRDPVAVWNDRVYPATGRDKERYRRRATAILARRRAERATEEDYQP